MKEAVTKLRFISKSSASVYIPDEIVLDNDFPFLREAQQEVKIRIEGKKLVVERLKE